MLGPRPGGVVEGHETGGVWGCVDGPSWRARCTTDRSAGARDAHRQQASAGSGGSACTARWEGHTMSRLPFARGTRMPTPFTERLPLRRSTMMTVPSTSRRSGPNGSSCRTTRSPVRREFHSNLSTAHHRSLLPLPGTQRGVVGSRCRRCRRVGAPTLPIGCVHRRCECGRCRSAHGPRPPRPRPLRRGSAVRGGRLSGPRTSSRGSLHERDRRRARPSRHLGAGGAVVWSPACRCGRGAVGGEQGRPTRRARPPLRPGGRMERWVSREHLAAPAALTPLDTSWFHRRFGVFPNSYCP